MPKIYYNPKNQVFVQDLKFCLFFTFATFGLVDDIVHNVTEDCGYK